VNKRVKTPLRRCTGCFEMKDKKELIRVVRVEHDEKGFILDSSGKMNGRGAYICPKPDCLNLARKKKGLERSFKQAIPEEVYAQLEASLHGQKNGS